MCGMGTQNRLAVCSKDYCDSKSKPELTRPCSSDKLCGGEWFTGPWGKCSDSCNGQAKQTRDVICVVKLKGHARITNDITCPLSQKPDDERVCDGTCPPNWFTGDWSECEGNCPNGVQRREVRCMTANGQVVNSCKMEEMPVVKRPCACQVKRDDLRDRQRPAHDEPIDCK